MRGQAGFWDMDERYVRLGAAGDPLEKLSAVVPWEVFCKPLCTSLKRSGGAKGGRPPYDAGGDVAAADLRAKAPLPRRSR
jgi:transposase, IS5 family